MNMLDKIYNFFSLLGIKPFEYVLYIPEYQTHMISGDNNRLTLCNMVIDYSKWRKDYNEDSTDGYIFVCENCINNLPEKILNLYVAQEGNITKD